MTELNLQEIADNPSTVIDTGTTGVKSGGGKVAPDAQEPPKTEARKPESARDSLEAEFKKIADKPETDTEEDDDEPEAKAEAPKAKEPSQEPKPAKAEGEAASEAAKSPKPSEGRKIIEAPARFLPRAKELWQNVPHPVREEFDRVMKENETEVARYREAQTFREELREYEEMARAHNVPLKQALANYVGIEKTFAENPAQGFRQIMQNMGMHPKQALVHMMEAVGVSPQQLASHMAQNPHEYTALAQPMPQRQQPQQAAQQPNPEVGQLKQQIEELRLTQVTKQVKDELIDPFLSDEPDAREYWKDIEEFILSGMIEKRHGTSVSPRDKIEIAWSMVKAMNGITSTKATVQDDSADQYTPAVDLRGGKSVKSSPGTVTNVSEPAKKLPVRDMLEEELRKLQRRA
jgi:hypothetical protein